jgi:outer membrane receptor protein involved in Fe transport
VAAVPLVDVDPGHIVASPHVARIDTSTLVEDSLNVNLVTVATVDISDDLDISRGKHALRTGLQFEAGRYHSDERRNASGTFTFADLTAFNTARPTTFTRNVGDPRVSIAQAQTGIYVQDDYRARKELTLSAGVRGEFQ